MNVIRFLTAAPLAAVAIACVALPARASVDAASQRVITQSGTALGVTALAKVHVLRMRGTIAAIGLHGEWTTWSGIGDGRAATYTTLAPYQQDNGYDGRVAWNRDGAGVVWNDGSDSGTSTAINGAYMQSYSLWKAGAGSADVRYVKSASEEGRTYDVLSVTPVRSKVAMQLWFDASTHLPARMVQPSGATTATTIFSMYKKIHGLMIPYALHVDSTDGNNADQTVASVAIDPVDGAPRLARPKPSVHDFSMRGNRSTTTVPIDLVENHVYLDVMLNGKGPYRFIFDTGGQNVVDPEVAKEIGAFGAGNAQGSGVGSQTESLSFAKVASLQVGDAVLNDQLFAVAPVRAGFGVSAGQPADGLIGWEVLARFVTSFTYAEKTVTLRLPRASAVPAGAHVVPFVFTGTQPQIACAIDGIPSECSIDTGARDTLSFYTPYLVEHPNVTPATVTENGVTGFGFGGPSLGRLGRVQSVTLGGFTLNDLIGDFSTQTAGALSSPFLAANLGGNLLRRFDITFDYGNQTMALVPNAQFAERDSYERAGLFLLRKDGRPVVADARPGTPAARAGIGKGDVITTIDGASTASMSLEAVRAFFFKPAGTVLTLGITGKNGSARSVTVTLADYV